MRRKSFPIYILVTAFLAVLTLFGNCERKAPSACDPDAYESNNTIENSYDMADVEENSYSFSARISSGHDTDFFSITAREGIHLGFPNTPQYFKMSFQLINPSGRDYDLYLYDNSGILIDQSNSRGDDDEIIEATWEGMIGIDDSYKFVVEVRSYSDDWSCEEYNLAINMSYSPSPW